MYDLKEILMSKARFSSLLNNSDNKEETQEKQQTKEPVAVKPNVELTQTAYSIVFNNATNSWGVATIKFNFSDNVVAEVIEFHNSGTKTDATYDFRIKASDLMQ
jgi:hypothetical protein